MSGYQVAGGIMDTSENGVRFRESYVHARNEINAATLILKNINDQSRFSLGTPLEEFLYEMKEQITQYDSEEEDEKGLLSWWYRFLGRAFTQEEKKSLTLEEAIRKLLHRAMIMEKRAIRSGKDLGIEIGPKEP